MDQAITGAVVNNPNLGRYELAVEGHIAAAYYHRSDDVITFDHTEVPPELGGKGIGSALVKGWIEKHPDYGNLLKV